jgi:multidrug resistance efflux pump
MDFATSSALFEQDNGRGSRTLFILASCILLAWSLWFFLSQIALYESTNRAFLRVDTPPLRVLAPVAGRVIFSNLRIGTQVNPGDLMLQIDSTTEQLALEQAEAEKRGVEAEMDALSLQISAAEQAIERASAEAAVSRDAQQAKVQELSPLATASAENAQRMDDLPGGAVPKIDVIKSRAAASYRQLKLTRLKLEAERSAIAHELNIKDRQVEIHNLKLRLVQLQRRQAQLTGAIKSYQFEISKRELRSPVAGVLANSSPLETGSYISLGESITLVIPLATPAVIEADFTIRSLGQLRQGQEARMRLESFPWTQFGELSSRVHLIDHHSRDGWVRVELKLDNQNLSGIPLQHGLTGLVEVTVDRLSPAALVARSLAGVVARHSIPVERES